MILVVFSQKLRNKRTVMDFLSSSCNKEKFKEALHYIVIWLRSTCFELGQRYICNFSDNCKERECLSDLIEIDDNLLWVIAI